MTAPLSRQGIPLRPDYGAVQRSAMRSFTRAVIAHAMGALDKTISPADFAARVWPDDRDAQLLMLRGAVSVATTTSAAAVLATTTIALLAALQPLCAGSELLARAISLSFEHAVRISVPSIAPPTTGFVAEGMPIPVLTAPTAPGPTIEPRKFASIIELSGEMIRNSGAENLVRQVLIESLGPALDRALFSATPGDDTRPAGLLADIVPLVATAGGGTDAMVGDLKQLAAAVAPVGGSGIVFIVPVARAVAMSALVRFPFPVLMSGVIPADMVIAVATSALLAAVETPPTIDASAQAVLHENDTPMPIVDGTPANPTRSLYQSDSVALKLRWPLSWALRDARGLAWLSGATW